MKRTPWQLLKMGANLLYFGLCGISHYAANLKAFVTAVILISASTVEMIFVVVLLLLC